MAEPYCIPLDRPTEWRSALHSVPHGFAHTWENCNAMYSSSALPTYLYVHDTASGRIVCPFSEREFEGAIDVVTPYGFSGFAGAPVTPDMKRGWQEFARERRYICGYIGLHPLLADHRQWPENEVFQQSVLYFLDLRQGAGELFRNLSTNRKRQITKWNASPAELVINDSDAARFIVDHAGEFFRSRGAAPIYQFDPETLTALVNLDNVLVVGIREEGRTCAATAIAYTQYVAEYLFNISLPGGEHYAAPLLWSAMLHLQEIRIPSLNLGGGIRDGDSVAEFKRRFGAAALPFFCLKQVYRPDAFGALCSRAGAEASDRSGYFPRYRRR